MQRLKSTVRHLNYIRLLRFGIGLLFLLQGIFAKEWIAIGLSGFLLITAFIQNSCCGFRDRTVVAKDSSISRNKTKP